MTDWLGQYGDREELEEVANTPPSLSSQALPYSKELNVEIENISTGYKPRPLQNLIHNSLKRFNVLVCHRRFGKTVLVINEMIDKALKNQLHSPQYAYIAPTYKQAKMIAWEYLQDFTGDLPGVNVNKSDITIEIHRQGVRNANNTGWAKKPDKIKLILLGSDNPDSIRGIYLDGCILDEFAQCDPIIWGEVVRPALSDRKGWAIFIGTPKGQNHFYHRFMKALNNPKWYAVMFKASETGIIDDEELEDMKSDMDIEEIEQELECSFTAAVRGSYYGEILNEMEEPKDGSSPRICSVPYNPRLPVDTVWDIGINDSCAIIFRQKVDGFWHYIDYIEKSGKGLEWFLAELDKKPYVYGRHIWPHDGANRDFVTGATRKEVAEDLGLRVEIQTRQSVDDGIQAVRRRLPISRFDKVKCARLLECMKNYQKEWDPKLMMFKNKPKHDWSSHGSDAFRYDALDDKDSIAIKRRMQSLPKVANSSYNEFD